MSETRLCVFARYPAPGTVKTRLVPPLDNAGAAALYRAFLLDALSSYSTLGGGLNPVVLVADPNDLERFRELVASEGVSPTRTLQVAPQASGDLGTRLAAAFAEGFAGGCGAVCAIGTDHPTLPLAYIRDAASALASHDVVLGPADDGGYYLVGTRAFHPDLFDGIAWSTNAVARQTLERADALGLSVALLPQWYDVDDADSLRRLVAEQHLLPPESRTLRALEALRLKSLLMESMEVKR